MMKQIMGFVATLISVMGFSKPQRVLRQLTQCKTAQELYHTYTPVTLQIRNPGKQRPANFVTLKKYIDNYIPRLTNADLNAIEVRFAEVPSVVPNEELFMAVYFVYRHSVFDTGLVAAAFDGNPRVTLTVRTEVVYDAYKYVEKSEGPNLCGEIAQPTEFAVL